MCCTLALFKLAVHLHGFLKPGMRSEVTVVNDLADLNKWTYGESDEQVKQVSTVRFGSLFHSCVKIVKRN